MKHLVSHCRETETLRLETISSMSWQQFSQCWEHASRCPHYACLRSVVITALRYSLQQYYTHTHTLNSTHHRYVAMLHQSASNKQLLIPVCQYSNLLPMHQIHVMTKIATTAATFVDVATRNSSVHCCLSSMTWASDGNNEETTKM